MRKGMLVIIMVAASFAGGAAINGPGLSMARSMLLGPRRDGDGLPTLPPRAIPAAPLPPLGPEPRPGDAARGPADAPAAGPSPTAPMSAPEPAEAATPHPDTLPPAEPPAVEPPASASASADRDVAPATHAPKLQEVAPAATPAEEAPRDWPELRRRLAAEGVSRYEFRGEPGGRAWFSCVIPTAGRRAVGQSFEAEGDDEFKAADAALRRIALWRASGSPTP